MPDNVETPTQAALKAWKPESKTVTDATGRVLVFKPHDLLSKMRLIGVVGSEKAKNDIYMGYLLIVTSVQSIDGVPCLTPRTMAQIEQMIVQIGDVGVSAIVMSDVADVEADTETETDTNAV